LADSEKSSARPLTKLGSLITLGGLSGLFPGVRDIIASILAEITGVSIPEVSVWVALIVLVIGVGIVVLDQIDARGMGRAAKLLLALKHTSLSDIQPMSLDQQDAPTRDGRLSVEQIHCDLTIEMAHGHTEIAAAIRKQQRIMQELAVRLQANPRPKLAYYGIAHIPFQLLAGCQLTHTAAYLYEQVRESGTWQELQTGRLKAFAVNVQKTGADQSPASLVIRIAVSFPVELTDIKDVVAAPFDDVLISVAQPRRDLVTSYQQVEALALAFREALDQGMQRLSRGGSVHVFYAGPMSVGFELGRRISVSNHPAVIVIITPAKPILATPGQFASIGRVAPMY